MKLLLCSPFASLSIPLIILAACAQTSKEPHKLFIHSFSKPDNNTQPQDTGILSLVAFACCSQQPPVCHTIQAPCQKNQDP